MNKGFTITELLIVMGLVVAISGISFSWGNDFLESQELHSDSHNFLSTLRRSYFQASFQKNDSSFGVKTFTDKYVLFQGSNYSSRDQSNDEEFDLSGGINFESSQEIVFDKLTGEPSFTGDIKIQSSKSSSTISINSEARIEIK